MQDQNKALTRQGLPKSLEILAQAALVKHKEPLYIELVRVVTSQSELECLAGTQVSKMKHDDPEQLELLLIEAIAFVNETINIPKEKKMGTFQIIDAVTTIIKEHWDIKVEEVVKALNNGRIGKYGEIYSRIDIATLNGWIYRYKAEERERALEESRRVKPEEKKALPPPLIPQEKLKEYREQFAANMQKIVDRRKEDKQPNDEKFFRESFINNLPMLTLDALRGWKKTLKIAKEKDLLELVEKEIAHRETKNG